jgi:hypothetical protein
VLVINLSPARESPTQRQAPASLPGHGAGDARPNRAASAQLYRAIEALILALLARFLPRSLLPRRRLLASAWHQAALPEPAPPAILRVRSIHDGTHLVCEHPILWVIGPGPCRGMPPRPRALPIPRPRIARAPPPPSRARRPVSEPSAQGVRTHAHHHFEINT